MENMEEESGAELECYKSEIKEKIKSEADLEFHKSEIKTEIADYVEINSRPRDDRQYTRRRGRPPKRRRPGTVTASERSGVSQPLDCTESDLKVFIKEEIKDEIKSDIKYTHHSKREYMEVETEADLEFHKREIKSESIDYEEINSKVFIKEEIKDEIKTEYVEEESEIKTEIKSEPTDYDLKTFIKEEIKSEPIEIKSESIDYEEINSKVFIKEEIKDEIKTEYVEEESEIKTEIKSEPIDYDLKTFIKEEIKSEPIDYTDSDLKVSIKEEIKDEYPELNISNSDKDEFNGEDELHENIKTDKEIRSTENGKETGLQNLQEKPQRVKIVLEVLHHLISPSDLAKKYKTTSHSIKRLVKRYILKNGSSLPDLMIQQYKKMEWVTVRDIQSLNENMLQTTKRKPNETNSEESKKPKTEVIYCMMCQVFGHVVADAYNNDCIACLNCGIKGHSRPDCTYIPGVSIRTNLGTTKRDSEMENKRSIEKIGHSSPDHSESPYNPGVSIQNIRETTKMNDSQMENKPDSEKISKYEIQKIHLEASLQSNVHSTKISSGIGKECRKLVNLTIKEREQASYYLASGQKSMYRQLVYKNSGKVKCKMLLPTLVTCNRIFKGQNALDDHCRNSSKHKQIEEAKNDNPINPARLLINLFTDSR